MMSQIAAHVFIVVFQWIHIPLRLVDPLSSNSQLCFCSGVIKRVLICKVFGQNFGVKVYFSPMPAGLGKINNPKVSMFALYCILKLKIYKKSIALMNALLFGNPPNHTRPSTSFTLIKTTPLLTLADKKLNDKWPRFILCLIHWRQLSTV